MGVSWVLDALLLCALISCSAFFSLAETALMAVNRVRLDHLARTDERARLVERIRRAPERLIGTVLFCNNLANVALSAVSTALLVAAVGPEGVLYATLAITVVLLVFCEITPKTLAAHYPDRIAMLIAPAVGVCIRLFYPVVRVFSAASGGLIALLGLKPPPGGERLTPEEIETLIETSGESGVLARDQREMLLGVLTLRRTTVGDIMIPMRDVVSFHVDAPWPEVVEKIRRSEFSRYPVYEKALDDPLGLIHVRDLLAFPAGEGFSLRKILRPAVFVPELRPIRRQVTAFQKRRAHLSFVVDEYGTVVGIVTLEDVIEEIIGDITDEYDAEPSDIRALPDGSWDIEGGALIRDVNRRLDLDLPEEDVRTLGGLVMKGLGRVPLRGEAVETDGYRVEVEEVTGRAVTRARLVRLPPGPPPGEEP